MTSKRDILRDRPVELQSGGNSGAIIQLHLELIA
jgi:hypothetical protein